MDNFDAYRIVFYSPWFFFFWGACWGSFLNVVMYRYPRKLSVVHPPSACQACQRPIAMYDNIPVLSWLLLWGRCRHCKAKFSPAYALNEALFGLICAGVVYALPNQILLGVALSTGLLALLPCLYLWIRYRKAPVYLWLVWILCGLAAIYLAVGMDRT